MRERHCTNPACGGGPPELPLPLHTCALRKSPVPAVRNLGPLGGGTTENAVYHGRLHRPVPQGAQPSSGSSLLAHGREDAGHFAEDPRAEAWRDPAPSPLAQAGPCVLFQESGSLSDPRAWRPHCWRACLLLPGENKLNGAGYGRSELSAFGQSPSPASNLVPHLQSP